MRTVRLNPGELFEQLASFNPRLPLAHLTSSKEMQQLVHDRLAENRQAEIGGDLQGE